MSSGECAIIVGTGLIAMVGLTSSGRAAQAGDDNDARAFAAELQGN